MYQPGGCGTRYLYYLGAAFYVAFAVVIMCNDIYIRIILPMGRPSWGRDFYLYHACWIESNACSEDRLYSDGYELWLLEINQFHLVPQIDKGKRVYCKELRWRDLCAENFSTDYVKSLSEIIDNNYLD